MREVVVVAAVRTPITRAHKGSLKDTRPDDLCAAVLRELVARVPELDPGEIEDVVVGCANPEGEQGLNIARQAVLLADLPVEVAGVTVSRACASGLQAVCYAAHTISQELADVCIAAGVESMTRVPPAGFNFSPNPRLAQDPPNAYISMGLTAENVAELHQISRTEQDEFAYSSHMKAVRARGTGCFSRQLVPLTTRVETAAEDGGTEWRAVTVTADECPRDTTSVAALSQLKPVFKQDGTVTAGNSSPLSDGAAGVLLMSGERAAALRVRPLARIGPSAVAGVPPSLMGLGPVPAVKKLLSRTGLTMRDIDLVELNEAFAAQAIACVKLLEIDPLTLNVNGGAIALGHPLGASGCRILADLVHELERVGLRRGLATLCIGGGQGLAMLVERE